MERKRDRRSAPPGGWPTDIHDGRAALRIGPVRVSMSSFISALVSIPSDLPGNPLRLPITACSIRFYQQSLRRSILHRAPGKAYEKICPASQCTKVNVYIS